MKGFLLLAFFLAACRKDPIEVRREPKESPLPAAATASARPRGLSWTAPAGWKELVGSGMRVSTFELPKGPGKAEATVVALPGDVGGELANVNRWRGQIALPPLSESNLAGARTKVRSRAGDVLLYDFVGDGKKKTRLVAGMIQVAGTTWFFKLMGNETTVAAAKPSFLELLSGLRGDKP